MALSEYAARPVAKRTPTCLSSRHKYLLGRNSDGYNLLPPPRPPQFFTLSSSVASALCWCKEGSMLELLFKLNAEETRIVEYGRWGIKDTAFPRSSPPTKISPVKAKHCAPP